MFRKLLTFKESSNETHQKSEPPASDGRVASSKIASTSPFSEKLFTRLLCLERKRAERSRKPFALILVDAGKLLLTDQRNIVVERLMLTLSVSIRETDICGWYKESCVIGVILTEIGSADAEALRNTMLSKFNSVLQSNLGTAQANEIHISFHVFPENPDSQNGGPADTSSYLYPDLQSENDTKKTARLLKRAIDIVGSLIALIVLSPWFLGIAIAIKLTSKGPILFKQKRIGQYGVPFIFLKFRSMYFLNDPKIHQEYVTRLISGNGKDKQSEANDGIYKLKDDPRITPVGKFLRKTSLDEFPQFFNVLRGEMSLVGPRPPIPYEIEVYDIWHRRRFLEAKPGITGLWQVRGRSKMKFDEMVRLDLRYAKDWSLGMDLTILLQTPRAVLFGKDAY